MKWFCDKACGSYPTWERPTPCPHCCGWTTDARAEALRLLDKKEKAA